MNDTSNYTWMRDTEWRSLSHCWDYREGTSEEDPLLAYTYGDNNRWKLVVKNNEQLLIKVGYYDTLDEAKAVAEALVAMNGGK